MKEDTKTNLILSYVFAVIGFIVFSVVFNTLGAYLGYRVKEEGGSAIPFYLNLAFLLMFIGSLIV